MRTIQKITLEYWALITEITGTIAVVLSVIYLALHNLDRLEAQLAKMKEGRACASSG
jgi:hypothetical protein